MSHAEWCREEALRARRGDGVGEVLPMGRRAEVCSLVFVGFALLLLLGLWLSTPDATFFAGEVTQPEMAAAEGCTVALAEPCERASSFLRSGMPVEIRRRSAFGTWRQATVRSVPACTDGGILSLKLEPGLPAIAPGTAVLMRVPRGRRPIYSRLGVFRRAEHPPAKGAG